MGPRSPAPLHTPVAPTPFPALNAQWTILKYHLQEDANTNTTWPAFIDRSIFATTLVKMTAELELLRNEVQYTTSLDHTNHLFEYDIPRQASMSAPPCTPRVRSSSPSAEIESKAGPFRGKRPTVSPTLAVMGPPLSVTVPSRCDSPRSPESDQLTPISPFSPSFGPRLGQIPSGTISRRRSGQHSASFDFLDVHAECTKFEQASRKIRSPGWEKRVQWEAAWAWIENHLEDYVQTFGKNIYVHATRHELWRELVRLRAEVVGLEEKLEEARKGGGEVAMRLS